MRGYNNLRWVKNTLGYILFIGGCSLFYGTLKKGRMSAGMDELGEREKGKHSG